MVLLLLLQLVIQGDGKPAVVFESGFGGNAESWSRVVPEVAKFARTVAYERGGERPRTATRIANELHEALKAAKVEPPYILVGHSAGGAYVRVFAHLYPKETAGIVLLDPPDEELLDWLRKNRPEMYGMPAEQVAKLPENMRAEWDAREEVIEEMRKAWPLPDVPVVLITSPRHDQSAQDALPIVLEARKKFIERAHAKHIPAGKSGHRIQMDEPELVIDAIRQLAGARASAAQ